MSGPTSISFEQGYARLQEIAERVNSDEVPVHEMCDLFAEGKGLDQALTAYLEEQKGRVEAIERGEGIQSFRIVPPGEAAAGESVELHVTGPVTPSAAPAGEDIPF